MSAIQTILHPTDFSENSRPAFETACALARDYQATLLVLHVMMPSVSPLTTEPLPDPSRPAESQGSTAEFPWPQPSDSLVRIQHRLAEGDAAEEILRLIEPLHCDMVVMGTHGKSGLGRLLTGSVAEEVLRKAPCPVLVVKTPLRSTADARPMPTANPGDIIDVRPAGNSIASTRTMKLFHTGAVDLVRLVVREGEEIPRHQNKGELIVQCLEGRIALTALGATKVLEAGQLVDLPPGEPHSLKGIEDASLLLTILAPIR